MDPKTTTSQRRSSWLARQRRGGPWPSLGQLALDSPEGLRRHTRYATRNLMIESPVYGWAVNVSESGVCLESLAELVAGARYVFRLRYGARFLNLSGRVAWSRLDRRELTRAGTVEVFQSGIELALEESGRRWLDAVEQLTGASLRA